MLWNVNPIRRITYLILLIKSWIHSLSIETLEPRPTGKQGKSVTRKNRKTGVVDSVRKDLELLEKTYEGGKKDPKMWYKGLFFLAYRLVSVGESPAGLDLLLRIPRNHLVGLLDGAVDDKFLSGIAYDMAEKLVDQKMAPVAPEPPELAPTQAEAMA